MTGDISNRYGGANRDPAAAATTVATNASLNPNLAGVLYQQGRVFSDADGNAATAIARDWEDTNAADVIGAGVAAVPADLPDSFAVTAATNAAGAVTLTLGAGRVWADGLLARLEGPPPVQRVATYFGPPVQNPAATPATIAAGVRDAVVLEVWREAVSAFQVPDQLIEPALGGPDTTERLVTSFALRLFRLAAGQNCQSVAPDLLDDPADHGRLTVTLQPTTTIPGDCPLVEGGGYTGFEHHLYRIEIAQLGPGAAGPMFKYSRFNGGLVGRGTFNALAHRVTITANLQPIITSSSDAFYLEAVEFDVALGRWRVTYGAAVTLNNDQQLVLPLVATFGAVPSGAAPVFFRLWDGIRAITDFPFALNPNELLDGIRLQFQPDAPGRYTPGNYWTFPVRAGGIANAQTLIDNSPPEGIRYHRVPLAELNWNAAGTLTPAEIEDCRHPFHPLTRLGSCCTYRVGDGVSSHGDFTSIQAAVDHLPAAGGEVCVLPGTYNENVLIDARQNVSIHGCWRRSRVISRGPGGILGAANPVFHVRNCLGVRIERLAIEAHHTGIGVLLESTPGGGDPDGVAAAPGVLADVSLLRLSITAAARSAVEAHVALWSVVADCDITMRDVPSPWAGIFFIGADSRIERNTIRVAQREARPGVPPPEDAPLLAGAGRGGVQLGGTCERLRVLGNLIQGGVGNGITLGTVRVVGGTPGEVIGWVVDADDPCSPCLPGNVVIVVIPGTPGRFESAGDLYDIYIEDNRILDMGLNGIGVIGFFDLSLADEFITVSGLTIAGNEIRRCLRRPLAPIPAAMADSMGYGGIALADVERLVVHHNVIERNGFDHLDPVCGVFVLHGEGIRITDNRVVNNGAKTSEPAAAARPGPRGGIVVLYGVAETAPLQVGEDVAPVQSGPPALVVHDNVVSAPLGPALRATALGPVSVHANEFTSLGVVPRRDWTTFDGATVLILNLGVSNEFYLQMTSFAAAKAGAAKTPGPGFDDARVGRLLANGNVLFSDNQCVLSLLETGLALASASVAILSLDDVAFLSNQCDCDLRDDFVLSQLVTLALSVRASDNRFKEGLRNAFLSAITFGVMNTTTDNQATHCLLIRGWHSGTWNGVVDTPNTVLVQAFNAEACAALARVLPEWGAINT